MWILPQISLAFGDSDTTKSYTIPTLYAGRRTLDFKIKNPDFTNAVTATFDIIDEAGDTIYSVSGLAENAVHFLMVDRPVRIGTQLKVTLSGAPGGSGGIVTIDANLADN